MSALADLTPQKLSRRKRAAKTVEGALRGGILGAAAGAIGWLIGSVVFGTALLVMVVGTILAAVYTVARGDKTRYSVWGVLAIGWAIVLVEHWAVSGHGGFWVGMATWLGVILGARRAGISKWSLPWLAFPAVIGVLLALTDHSVLKPFGISWLWIAFVLGPVIGARTLLNPSPKVDQSQTKPDPLAGL
jgi:hypothetical protein